MTVHPTRNAVDLTVVGILLLIAGFIQQNALWAGWAGSLLLGLQLARAITVYSVAGVRKSGFEMLWMEPKLRRECTVGKPLTLTAEVRNRDGRAARYIGLRSLHSPNLNVSLAPSAGEVPAQGSLRVDVLVTANRVGRHGLYGLSLELQGSPGLFEVPLTFANPFGIEALPEALGNVGPSRQGALRHGHRETRASQRAGGDFTLRELRDYAPGDAFKRIAWKASARRGTLMTKQFDLPERGVVWMLIDASVELWSGTPGRAPLDAAIRTTAKVLAGHLRRGDSVGLALIGHRRLTWIAPGEGAHHRQKLLQALTRDASLHAADRSGYTLEELASRVREHLQPLAALAPPAGTVAEDLTLLAAHARGQLARGPFAVERPPAENVEGVLRAYAIAFGLPERPRLEPDRPRTTSELLSALREIAPQKPSRVYLCAPPPDPANAELLVGLRAIPARRSRLYWLMTQADAGLRPPENTREAAVHRAAQWRAQAAREFGATALRRAGVRAYPAHSFVAAFGRQRVPLRSA